MFGGNNTIQSSWANPQQNPQQQQQPGGSAFGQPGAFGSAGAFGAGGGAFGQNPQQQQQQQQQQPQANPMFGNLGAGPSNPTGTSGFGGGFGGAANPPANANPMFGGPKPATGFSAFSGGGTSGFGGGGGFGAANANNNPPAQPSGAGTGLFGQSNTGTSAFGGGAGGGLFGNKPAATSAFGANTTATQAGVYDGVPPVTTGTVNPPYSVYSEKDGANSNITLQYQSISCMPHYRGTSTEELRLQDYAQGRKTANAGGFSQPQPSAFGAAQPATTGTGLFGQAAQPAQQNPTSAFGAFGTANNANPTGGAFAALGQNTSAQPTTGTGAFGAFGQPQQQPTTGFSAFGQQPQPPQQQQPQPQPQQPQQNTGGLFGGGGAFGQQQSKPLSAFGGGGAFSGGSAFGQQNQQQQQLQPPATGGGLFGQTQPNTGAFGGGAFGAANAAKPSAFGQPAQPASGLGLFGAQNQQNQGQPGQQLPGGLFGGGGGLFGQQNNQQQNQASQPQQGGGLFGGTQPTQQSQTGGLFGGGGGGGGLFGNNTQQQQPNQQQPAQANNLGLFGARPAAPATGGGLFGGGSAFGQTNANNPNAAAPQQSTGLFGAPLSQSTNQPSTGLFGGGGGLFGAKPAAPALGLSQLNAQPLGGSSLFGNTLNASALNTTAGQQGSLFASIDQPVTKNLPIFSMLPAQSNGLNFDQYQKKKTSMFEPPSSLSRPLGYKPGKGAATTKLRGYNSIVLNASTISPTPTNALGLSSLGSKPNPLGLSGFNGRGSNGSEAFGSSVLGAGSKTSVKKLVLDRKIDAADLLRRGSSPSPGKASFNPALSVAAREKQSVPTPPAITYSPAPTTRNRGSITGPPSAGGATEAARDGVVHEDKEPQEGDYWCKPSVPTLSLMSFDDIAELKGLVVGRVGFGRIEFLDPVDLTTLAKLSHLLGEQIRFDTQECIVYPDSDDIDKPPPGSGLNVRARITLLRCWPLDKATREPIKDETHPQVIKHTKRLKHMKGTKFEGFDIQEGRWTFTVEHF